LNTPRSFIAATAVGLLLLACGGGKTASPAPTVIPSPTDTANMKIAIDSTFIKSVPVGVSTNFDLDIQDVGTVDIPNLSLVFDDGDRFMDKYTIENAGSCQVDTSLPGLACGKLTLGTHLKFTIKAKPKAAGSYVFKFHVDQYKTPLYEADDTEYVYSWTQTVTS
jgi:hypothetical protein